MFNRTHEYRMRSSDELHIASTCTSCKSKLGKPNYLRCGNKNSSMFEKPVSNNYGCGNIKHI